MKRFYLKPYSKFANKDYPFDVTIVIRAAEFTGIHFQDGQTTFSFSNCRFGNIRFENEEGIDFPDISVFFTGCYIKNIDIEAFTTTNFSIYFYSSILGGRIANGNILRVNVDNCLLHRSLFLLGLKQAVVSYNEENISPVRWKSLLKSLSAEIDDFKSYEQGFYIYDCKTVVFSLTEETSQVKGLYKKPYATRIADRIGYRLTDEEKKTFKLKLSLQYSADIDHVSTKIVNAKLTSLSITGYSSGEVNIEGAKIDNIFIRNFSTQLPSNFYDIKPFRPELGNSKFEVHKSNLDHVWFDNVAFDSFSVISFYRNKFGQTMMTSCEFPKDYKGFEKFKTVENIHYPDKIDESHQKVRYETFVQLRKLLEASGNFYESQKLQAVSNEALLKISNLPWSDKIILKINSLSNNHGLSIAKPFFGTLTVCSILYILYLWTLGRIFNPNCVDLNLIGYYFAFLDITHRNDFLVDKCELTGLSIVVDYLNKVLVGFLIYQFIAAFRKYGKS
ncbi:MAG: hypothetical protein K0S09_1891 [Sphingobacteriaceae bacterium]|jgi:hypothetical protein|nr:hypothetical protein [Sphingobacteriaceae bacterium]